MLKSKLSSSLSLRVLPFVTAVMLLVLANVTFPTKASAQTDTSILASLTPYTATVAGYKSATCSSGGYCTMKFPPVPAGHRLLVSFVSLNTFSQANTLGAVLSNGLAYSDAKYRQINLPGGVVAKNTSSGFGYVLNYSGLTTFYFEAGDTPTFVYYGSVLTNDFAGFGSVTGVLVPTN